MALRVIIYGGNGALGKVIVNHFKTKNHVSIAKYYYIMIFYNNIGIILGTIY